MQPLRVHHQVSFCVKSAGLYTVYGTMAGCIISTLGWLVVEEEHHHGGDRNLIHIQRLICNKHNCTQYAVKHTQELWEALWEI